MLRCVVDLVAPDVSKEGSVFTFRYQGVQEECQTGDGDTLFCGTKSYSSGTMLHADSQEALHILHNDNFLTSITSAFWVSRKVRAL
jgi:hypothetical protein